MHMKEHVGRFVALKRHLGCRYENEERLLLAWADEAMALGEDFVRAETMIRFASDTPSPGRARRRLSCFRQFAEWLHSEDDRHEIPHMDALGRARVRRRTPYLLGEDEVKRLMEAALRLPPAGSITPHTLYCVIGLVAVTGLRRSEVCGLRFPDITPDGLVIRETKFRKSRLVPLHPSSCDALAVYLEIRKQLGGASDALFVLSNGKPLNRTTLTTMFVKLARATGLRGGPGEPGVRLHDLRHRFSVASLEQAIATDRDRVSRHMLALSTYLGHSSVTSTYWYLEATPTLLKHIACETENARMQRIRP